MTRRERRGKRTSVQKTAAADVDALRPEEAVAVLQRLAGARGPVGEAVHEAVRAKVLDFETEDVSEEVYWDLDWLSVADLWDRSGSTSSGYVEPIEEAWNMIEETLQPHVERIRQYQNRGLTREAREYCLAVLGGIDRYDRESTSTFKSHSPDSAAEAFDWVSYEWKDGVSSKGAVREFQREVAELFPARS